MKKCKKIIASVLGSALTLCSVPLMGAAAAISANAESTVNIYEMVKGRDLDFNSDGNVNKGDWAMYFAYGLYLDDQDPYTDAYDKLIENGDLDNDGEITENDMMILMTVVDGDMKDYLPGDVNLDGVVNGTDATLALNCYTQLSAGISQNEIRYCDLIKGYGDMDGDGKITGSDATVILNIYTDLSSQ